jgi:hypothetical protein
MDERLSKFGESGVDVPTARTNRPPKDRWLRRLVALTGLLLLSVVVGLLLARLF